MPIIKYYYTKFSWWNIDRPCANVVVYNPFTGKHANFVALIDTGADTTTLTKDTAADLGIDIESLPIQEIFGLTGPRDSWFCDFLKIFLIYKDKEYSINRDTPVPIFFSDAVQFPALGQRNMLRNCVAAFDGVKASVTLEF